jgi:hypothetical protein
MASSYGMLHMLKGVSFNLDDFCLMSPKTYPNPDVDLTCGFKGLSQRVS